MAFTTPTRPTILQHKSTKQQQQPQNTNKEYVENSTIPVDMTGTRRIKARTESAQDQAKKKNTKNED